MNVGDKYKRFYNEVYCEVEVKEVIEDRRGYMIFNQHVEILDENVTEEEKPIYEQDPDFEGEPVIEEKKSWLRWFGL